MLPADCCIVCILAPITATIRGIYVDQNARSRPPCALRKSISVRLRPSAVRPEQRKLKRQVKVRRIWRRTARHSDRPFGVIELHRPVHWGMDVEAGHIGAGKHPLDVLLQEVDRDGEQHEILQKEG